MSTSPSALSSQNSTYFTGLSTYSSDLNSAISREVQIASLPIQILQNDVTTLNGQVSEMQTVNSDVQAVQSAIAALATASGSMLSASVSNPAVGAAALASNATAGSYSLEVDNLGSYSDALSIDGLPVVTDPTAQSISSSGTYTLTVNGQTVQPPLQPAGASLDALAQAINGANAGVQAAVVNVGGSSAPDYRLSLQSTQYGSVSMQLNDGAQDLLAASGSPGQAVQYIVDGKSIQSSTRTVTLAPGLTMNLTGANVGAPATVTVAPNAAAVSSALQTFVSAYNTAMAELDKNVGQSGGALAGQSVVYDLINGLQAVANYSGGGSLIPSLSSLGVTFNDTTGVLSFDQTAFDSAGTGQTDALSAFLGSAAGGGFLQVATNTLSSLVDPGNGILTQDISSVESSIASTTQQITDQQNSVNLLQQNLTQQMTAADAMIYSLQQQASYLTDMFAAERSAQMAGLA